MPQTINRALNRKIKYEQALLPLSVYLEDLTPISHTSIIIEATSVFTSDHRQPFISIGVLLAVIFVITFVPSNQVELSLDQTPL